MKRLGICAISFLLLITTACGDKNTPENVHKRVHNLFYTPCGYTARCTVNAYTAGGHNTYACKVVYDNEADSYTVISDDMTMEITAEKTVISKDQNSVEVPSEPDDMYMFVNTFFKHYYQSESTCMTVSADSDSVTLFECDAVNSDSSRAHMKLWVYSETALPQKMQVFSDDGFMHTEIIFNEFNVGKQL